MKHPQEKAFQLFLAKIKKEHKKQALKLAQ